MFEAQQWLQNHDNGFFLSYVDNTCHSMLSICEKIYINRTLGHGVLVD